MQTHRFEGQADLNQLHRLRHGLGSIGLHTNVSNTEDWHVGYGIAQACRFGLDFDFD
ncbi:hypothetical protein G3N57_10100 [Paraburkholderia sp. Se-20369]|nr:hypothetical protein [Paraburkholderia sp. Se-20369]